MYTLEYDTPLKNRSVDFASKPDISLSVETRTHGQWDHFMKIRSH